MFCNWVVKYFFPVKVHLQPRGIMVSPCPTMLDAMLPYSSTNPFLDSTLPETNIVTSP